MDKEIWKDITGFVGFYQVSNLGRVRSLDRVVKGESGIEYRYRGQIMKPTINTTGYLSVNLRKPNKKYFKTVHRLIAIEFIQNPDNKPCINHIDGNKLNNDMDNLEWCTYSENNKHALDVGLRSNPKHIYYTGKLHKDSKAVIKFDVYGNKISEYDSVEIAATENNLTSSSIARCCRDRKGCSGYFQWRFKSEYRGASADFIGVAKGKVLLMFSKNGEYIDTFKSPIEAKRKTGINEGSISSCASGRAKSAGGYLWTYL